MARAVEKQETIETDDMLEIDTNDGWHDDVEGEAPESSTTDTLNLAHRVAGKFPELSKRYQNYAGPVAVVSGALIALAGVAVARRLRKGQSADEIYEQITPEEIESAAGESSRRNKVVRLVKRVALRRQASQDEPKA
jgi:hypothetical protein